MKLNNGVTAYLDLVKQQLDGFIVLVDEESTISEYLEKGWTVLDSNIYKGCYPMCELLKRLEDYSNCDVKCKVFIKKSEC